MRTDGRAGGTTGEEMDRQTDMTTLTVAFRHFANGPKKGTFFVSDRHCGRLPAEIVSSNPTGGMDICLL